MKMREVVFGRQLDGGLQCRLRNIHAIHADGIEGDELINLGIALLQLQAALRTWIDSGCFSSLKRILASRKSAWYVSPRRAAASFSFSRASNKRLPSMSPST